MDENGAPVDPNNKNKQIEEILDSGNFYQTESEKAGDSYRSSEGGLVDSAREQFEAAFGKSDVNQS